MVTTAREHDPFVLFEFALQESDWELADLIACFLLYDRPARLRAQRILLDAAERLRAPESLAMLHRMALLSRNLKLGGD